MRPKRAWSTVPEERRAPPEAELWGAVVWQALVDAARATRFLGQRTVAATRDWLSSPSPDRDLVLAWAGIDPDAWDSHAVPRLRAHWAAIDAGTQPWLRHHRPSAARQGRQRSPDRAPLGRRARRHRRSGTALAAMRSERTHTIPPHATRSEPC